MNIIYVICHDLGRELGCYGKPIQTPVLDSFAKESALFTNAYCSSPACSPSRGCGMTGMYAHTNGLMGIVGTGWSLDVNVKTVVDYLNDAGYETVHTGHQHERIRNEDNRYQIEMLNETADQFVENAISQAIGYLSSRKEGDRPFYLNIGTSEVHTGTWMTQSENTAPRRAIYGTTPETEIYMPPYIIDTPELRNEMGSFQACIRYFDNQLKRLFDAVTALGYENDTLVIFTTDHGISNERAKGSLYGAGIEISLMARLPGVINPGTVIDNLIQNIDLAPTILEAAGIDIPESMQGKSFWSLMTGNPYMEHQELFLERNYHGQRGYDPMRAVRTKNYHYILNFDKDAKRSWLPDETPNISKTYQNWFTELWPKNRPDRDRAELFDLTTDPLEFHNIAKDPKMQSICEELRAKVDLWMKKTSDPLLQGRVPHP